MLNFYLTAMFNTSGCVSLPRFAVKLLLASIRRGGTGDREGQGGHQSAGACAGIRAARGPVQGSWC